MKTQLLVAAGFFLLCLLSPLKVLAENFTKIYIFGDSLSDAGNLYKATNFQIPPSPPYFQGRFSNGKVWVEYLGNELKLTPTLFTNLQTNTPTEGINYAFGGATSGLGNTIVSEGQVPGVLGQVGLFTQYLKQTNQQAERNALYIVWGGANDYLSGSVSNVTKPIANLSTAVALLAVAGAKNIMVPNLPDLGKIPVASSTGNSSQLTALSQKHNAALAVALRNLDSIPGVNIIPVDINSLFNQAQTNPGKFGFTNVTEPCLIATSNDIAQGNFSVCSNPDNYLFWDNTHPTTRAHSFVAQSALSALRAKSISQPWTTSQAWNLQF